MQACQGPHSHSMILERHTGSQRMWPEPRHSFSAGMPQTDTPMTAHPASQLDSCVGLPLRCGSAQDCLSRPLQHSANAAMKVLPRASIMSGTADSGEITLPPRRAADAALDAKCVTLVL